MAEARTAVVFDQDQDLCDRLKQMIELHAGWRVSSVSDGFFASLSYIASLDPNKTHDLYVVGEPTANARDPVESEALVALIRFRGLGGKILGITTDPLEEVDHNVMPANAHDLDDYVAELSATDELATQTS